MCSTGIGGSGENLDHCRARSNLNHWNGTGFTRTHCERINSYYFSCIHASMQGVTPWSMVIKTQPWMVTEWPVVHALQLCHEIIFHTKQDIGKLHVSYVILACNVMGWPLRSRKMCWVGWPGNSWQDMTQNIPLMSRSQKCQIPQESWNPRKWVQGSEEDNDRTFNWCSRA